MDFETPGRKRIEEDDRESAIRLSGERGRLKREPIQDRAHLLRAKQARERRKRKAAEGYRRCYHCMKFTKDHRTQNCPTDAEA
jgi:hypothetical protein